MGLSKFLLIPQLMWYGVRAPRQQGKAWDRFWAGIERTGAGGQVLWDAASREELDGVLARVLPRMDATLPVVDVGCGNGRFARLLAPHFPKVLGIDVSPSATRKRRANRATSRRWHTASPMRARRAWERSSRPSSVR